MRNRGARRIFLLLIGIILMTAAMPCSADIDPILLNKPNDAVFGCRNDIFIELLDNAVISNTIGGRVAEQYYLYLKAEILFLVEGSWDGLDKSSFSVLHTAADGSQETYPLDYAITMITNLRNEWKTLSDRLKFTSLTTYYLVFDVPAMETENWTLQFRPTQRGGSEPYCVIEIPLKVR